MNINIIMCDTTSYFIQVHRSNYYNTRETKKFHNESHRHQQNNTRLLYIAYGILKTHISISIVLREGFHCILT